MNRILVIDDDAEVRFVIRELLEREGYAVVQAADGGEALETLDSDTVELIITDIVMPEKEGIETITELRHRLPQVPIIAISGAGRGGAEDYLAAAELLGAAETFTKPFAPRELLAAVQGLLP